MEHPTFYSPTLKANGQGILSPRQTEVSMWVAEGKENWAIAKILDVSESNVKAVISAAMFKLKAFNRAHLVTKAFAAEILTSTLALLLHVMGAMAIQMLLGGGLADSGGMARTGRVASSRRRRDDLGKHTAQFPMVMHLDAPPRSTPPFLTRFDLQEAA